MALVITCGIVQYYLLFLFLFLVCSKLGNIMSCLFIYVLFLPSVSCHGLISQDRCYPLVKIAYKLLCIQYH